MSSVVTDYLPSERTGSEWYTAGDKVRETVKHDDSVRTYTINYTNMLASGETISSVSHDANGVTLSGTSNTTTAWTYRVTGTGGSVTTTVTTSASRTLIDQRRFRASRLASKSTDYRF